MFFISLYKNKYIFQFTEIGLIARRSHSKGLSELLETSMDDTEEDFHEKACAFVEKEVNKIDTGFKSSVRSGQNIVSQDWPTHYSLELYKGLTQGLIISTDQQSLSRLSLNTLREAIVKK